MASLAQLVAMLKSRDPHPDYEMVRTSMTCKFKKKDRTFFHCLNVTIIKLKGKASRSFQMQRNITTLQEAPFASLLLASVGVSVNDGVPQKVILHFKQFKFVIYIF